MCVHHAYTIWSLFYNNRWNSLYFIFFYFYITYQSLSLVSWIYLFGFPFLNFIIRSWFLHNVQPPGGYNYAIHMGCLPRLSENQYLPLENLDFSITWSCSSLLSPHHLYMYKCISKVLIILSLYIKQEALLQETENTPGVGMG